MESYTPVCETGTSCAGRDAPSEQYDVAALERVVQQFAGVASVRRYVAFLDGVAAGAASARVDAGIFQMCGAATLPRYRRNGVQSALNGQLGGGAPAVPPVPPVPP